MSTPKNTIIDPEKINLVQIVQTRSLLQGVQETIGGINTIFSPDIRIDEENAIVVIGLSTSIRTFDEASQELQSKADFTHDYHFHIENLNDFLTKAENGASIAQILATTLISISISTSRGIIWAYTKGTFLEGFMLPVINPAKLFGR